MKKLLSVFLVFASLTVNAATDKKYIVEENYCSDFSQQYVGEVCLMTLKDLQSLEERFLVVDLYDYYQRFNYKTTLIEGKTITVNNDFIELCDQNYFQELRLSFQAKCQLVKFGSFEKAVNILNQLTAFAVALTLVDVDEWGEGHQY